LPAELRDELNHLLDGYENGMRSSDRALFEESRQQLLIWLSSRGFSYDDEVSDGTEPTL
jgi:hypothetical protein